MTPLVTIKEIHAASIVMQQEIKRSDKILSRLNVEIVCVAADNFRPKKIPTNIKNLFDAR
jgi:acyl-CoA thioesterase FadM